MITNQSEAHGDYYRLAPRGYVFSVFAGRANRARTFVRRKIGRRRRLEISKRGSALPAFLRDKSRAPGEFLVGSLNRYPRRQKRKNHRGARRPVNSQARTPALLCQRPCTEWRPTPRGGGL